MQVVEGIDINRVWDGESFVDPWEMSPHDRLRCYARSIEPEGHTAAYGHVSYSLTSGHTNTAIGYAAGARKASDPYQVMTWKADFPPPSTWPSSVRDRWAKSEASRLLARDILAVIGEQP